MAGCRRVNPAFVREGPAQTDATPPVDGITDVAAEVVGDVEAPPSSALVGYWDLDQTTGTRVIDRSSKHLDGVWTGSARPAWQAGRVGGALAFDGADSWVEVADQADHLDEISNALTLAA